MNPANSGHSISEKTRSRLTAIIFIIAGTLLIITMVLTFRAGRVAIESQRKMNMQLNVVSELEDLLSMVKDAETGQRGYLLTGEENYLDPYTKSLPVIQTQLGQIQTLVDSGEIPGEDMNRVAGLIHQKLDELALTIKLKREAGVASALAEVKSDKGKNLMDDIRTNIVRMLKTAQENYDAAVQKADENNLWRNVVFVCVTLANLVFLAWAYRRIARQEWLQFGQARLTEKLTGDKSLREVGEQTVQFLAEYLGAQAGAIFYEESGAFHRLATYAVPSPDKLPQKFRMGEGLVGQAAKDKRAFVLKDAPADYLSIGSGLGASRARRLLIAPIKVDDSVNGVIELGFFNAASSNAELEFLERIAEPVGVTIRSAKYRTRLQELLEQTQQQAEELQTQSEELRVSNEELEEQSRALKESQSRLEQQQAELEQTNSQLEEQTQILENQKSDISRAKEDLEHQSAVIEQASRYKSDFLANMSHELRTPLNSSLILAKLLADNREGNLTAEQIKYAQTIQAAGNDLLTLINDVLDLAKVEAGRMDLKMERFPVAHLLESLRGMFEPLATSKSLTLKLSVAPNAPASIETDRRKLEQALKNLLSNALKFTERGTVELTISTAPDRSVAFAVKDSGIGIAESQHEMVFQPFRQADGTTERKYGGTGLGLSISRELVRLMGGEIYLSSQLNHGSTFTIILPENYRPDRVQPARLPEEPPKRLISPLTTKSPATPARAQVRKARVPDDRERLTGTSHTILVVEDDDSFANIIIELSRELSFQALLAQTAEEALALAQQFQPSAVILDIGLPDNSGMFVLERLKADARTRHIPVHVVSGSDYSETALFMGAVGYMLKPVKREQLVDAFQKLEHRLTQKLRRVLVVEDDPVQLDSLGKLLGSRDVETVGVRTAAECLEKLKAATFDCMVLDLSLPDASGFSLLETLSNEETYSFPPVIIYTGRELTGDEEQRLRKYSKSIIIKGAKSPERLLDEVTLFLHQVVSELPAEQQRMLEKARSRDSAFEGKRILIAEDDVRNIFALTSLLEPKGIKLQIARNGREALQALENQKPNEKIDLVLMDIMMPDMNGLTAMREIRKKPAWQKLPIIALTAKAMKDDQEQCIQAGANDYLAKPLDVEKLLSLIRVWMPR